ncbi:baeRF11 domain-containing protein [Nocardia sp. NPDC004711]
MLHTDIPTRGEILALASTTGPWCVSVYTPTEADTPTPDKNRVAFENQVKEVLDRVTDKQARIALTDAFADLVDDEDYWRFQSRTLAVHATPEGMRTYRLPNRLEPSATLGDRFYIKPLLRAVTFPQTAFVLALSENAVRLVEVAAEGPAAEVAVAGLPTDLNKYLDLPPLGRSPHGRLQGSEGRKVRVRQFCRAVDQALRPVLAGHDIPLILAAAEPTDSLYRSVDSYPLLLAEGIPGNPEHLSDGDLAARARQLLDQHYAAELADVRGEFEKRRSDGRGVIDLSDIARAATYGIVHTLLVDIDASVPGAVTQDGALAAATGDGEAPGVLDEISRRVLLANGRVLAVRGDDIPDGAHAAAILRYAP